MRPLDIMLPHEVILHSYSLLNVPIVPLPLTLRSAKDEFRDVVHKHPNLLHFIHLHGAFVSTPYPPLIFPLLAQRSTRRRCSTARATSCA